MKTRRMKGGGFRSNSTMNAFINTRGGTLFHGILKISGGREPIELLIKPTDNAGGYNIECSESDYHRFNYIIQTEAIKMMFQFKFTSTQEYDVGMVREPPVLPSSDEPPPFAAVPPEGALRPQARNPMDMVRSAMNTPIIVSAEDVLLGNGFRPIFMKFNEDKFASIMYDWIFGNEDEFLMSFAVPNICFWTTRLSAVEYLSPGELAVLMPHLGNYPFTPDMFTLPFRPDIKTFLKSRPFRLRTLLVKDLGDGYRLQSVQFHEQKSYLPGFAFNYCDFDGHCPVGVPPDIYDLMIRSALSSCTLLEKIPERLISIDLYLNRHQPIKTAVVSGLPSIPSGFHSDSGTPFSNPKGPSNPLQAELLTHAKLVSIMEPNALSKSVSIMANISTTEDNDAVMKKAHASMEESVKLAAEKKIALGNYRNVITFISQNGTSCLFDDELIYHSSPWNDIPTTDTNVTKGLSQPSSAEEIGISGPTLLTQTLTPRIAAEIKRDKQRCLFRVHYSDKTTLKNRYEFYPGSEPMKYGLKGLMITEKPSVININRTPDGNVDLSELNDVFGPKGPLKSTGLAMGGKRTRKRKRKTRGGTLDPSILDHNIIVTVNKTCAPQGCVITGIN